MKYQIKRFTQFFSESHAENKEVIVILKEEDDYHDIIKSGKKYGAKYIPNLLQKSNNLISISFIIKNEFLSRFVSYLETMFPEDIIVSDSSERREEKLNENVDTEDKYAILIIEHGKKHYVTSVTKSIPHSIIGSYDSKINPKDSYLFSREEAIKFCKNNKYNRHIGIVNIVTGKQEMQ